MEVKHPRRSRKERVFRYQLQTYEAEMVALRRQKHEILEKVGLHPDITAQGVPNIPLIYKFIARPKVMPFLKKIQELAWTISSVRGGLHKIKNGSSADVMTPAAAVGQRSCEAPRAVSLESRPLLYVDITSTLRGFVGGGIARACGRIAASLCQIDNAKAVALFDGRLYQVGRDGRRQDPVDLASKDTYLILDAFWEPSEEYTQSLKSARNIGARTALCIHDVIPLIHPGLVDAGVPEWFEQRLNAVLPFVDTVVSVSRSSARQIRRALKQMDMSKHVVWFHLGHDSFECKAANEFFAETRGHRFISIGTLEPKKGYDCSLDAFDLLWDEGVDVEYMIIGRPGWACTALIERILAHKEFGTRLLWLKDASDEDVRAALSGSYCFVQASVAEGFGLPIVEAARFGLPVIASDLPVFREIAGKNILYFPVCDSDGLAALVKSALEHRPAKANIDSFTWDQSAEALLRALGFSIRHKACPIDP